jgi:hypothetical protein
MRIFVKRGWLQKNFDIMSKKTIVEIMPITMSIARKYKLLSQLNINKIVHEWFYWSQKQEAFPQGAFEQGV